MSKRNSKVRFSWRSKAFSIGPGRPLRTYQLWRAGRRLATVQEMEGGWFWYGAGMNTCSRGPVPLDQAKREALEHVRAERVRGVRQAIAEARA